jgi:hypothetical protein
VKTASTTGCVNTLGPDVKITLLTCHRHPDQTGAVTDTYDYDAVGNLLHSTSTTPALPEVIRITIEL